MKNFKLEDLSRADVEVMLAIIKAFVQRDAIKPEEEGVVQVLLNKLLSIMKDENSNEG